MNTSSKFSTILPLYLPWLLAMITMADPHLSYWIAWLGTFFIFYWSLLSPFRYISSDLPVYRQIMRPIFLTQLIFAGFMCTTSVFYYLDQLGYRYLEKVTSFDLISEEQISLIATCQRLSLLGHVALVTGMILVTSPIAPSKRYQLGYRLDIDNFLIILAVASYISGYIIQYSPAISQFSIGLTNTGIICGAFLLVKGIVENKVKILLVGGSIFVLNFVNATLTGYKEHILVNFLIIGCLIYPFYKKLTLLVGIPLICILFYILPTYVTVIRNQSWSGEISAEQARTQALETILDDERKEEIDANNWVFLTDRISEMGMFTQFVASTPSKIEYYGFDILKNSLEALVPRFLWENKPITEGVAMERVYAAKVIDRASIASAKTRPVVDGYLSAGVFGVFISMLIYGMACQAICNKAESLFGGYQLGCMVFFNGLFQSMWRGNNFEFIINSVFYSFILMLLIFRLLKDSGILVPINSNEDSSNQRLL